MKSCFIEYIKIIKKIYKSSFNLYTYRGLAKRKRKIDSEILKRVDVIS